MSVQHLNYTVNQVRPYINWIYFFHAWGFSPRFAAIAHVHDCEACRHAWIASFPEPQNNKAIEALKLYKEAVQILDVWENNDNPILHSVVGLFQAYSEEDDLLIYSNANSSILRFPLLRQQIQNQDGTPCLCLSDFVQPNPDKPNTIGAFAATVSKELEQLDSMDAYKQLLVQTLADRLVEATVEKTHEVVRKRIWGYAPKEDLSIPDMLAGKYQGIRPAVGYPSLPDQSVVFILNELLDMETIGIHLTENGAMSPHASVCGLMFSHPLSRYFSIGSIGQDQFINYCARRGKPQREMLKYLSGNLLYSD